MYASIIVLLAFAAVAMGFVPSSSRVARQVEI
jgi:hypothetical protein